jgi:hypothetical protein
MKKKVDHRKRSMKFYEDRGCIVASVETKNFSVLGPADEPGVLRCRMFGTRDLLGFADLVGWGPYGESFLCQYTSRDHHAERRTKVLTNEYALKLLARRVPIHVLSWGKPKGKRIYKPKLEILRYLVTGNRHVRVLLDVGEPSEQKGMLRVPQDHLEV